MAAIAPGTALVWIKGRVQEREGHDGHVTGIAASNGVFQPVVSFRCVPLDIGPKPIGNANDARILPARQD